MLRLTVAAAVAALGALAVSAGPAPEAAQAPRPLVTGVSASGVAPFDPDGPSPAVAAARIAAAGAKDVRLVLEWPAVAPNRPAPGSDPADPANPAYDWSDFDAQVTAFAARGLTPVVAIFRAPAWARDGDASSPASPPRIADWRSFVTAAARRYDGTHGRPKVRYWVAWLEPNLQGNLAPQLVNRVPVAAGAYRSMVNAMYAALNAVGKDNRLIVGGLGPFRDSTAEVVAQDSDWGPLSFMRALFCLSPSLQPTCRTPVRADIWDVHPYTSGGPGHRALLANDASLGDMDKIRITLDAARLAKNLVAPHGLGVWATEFAWDSSPPDPNGVPMPLLQRWVAHALYDLWRDGVTHVTWLQLRDDPIAASIYQSGLYLRGQTPAQDSPKPILRAFRFPFVALPRGGAITVWGRTPRSTPSRVVIELHGRAGWRRVATLRANGAGIFLGRLPLPNRTGRMRALADGRTSPEFGVAPVADRFLNPFGTTPPLETR